MAILVAVSSVWLITNLFAKMLHEDDKNACKILVESRNSKGRRPSIEWCRIYGTYKYIRGLCKLVNKVYGNLLTLFLTDGLFFFSANLDVAIATVDSTERYRFIMFVCGIAVTFLMAADICGKVINLFKKGN